jgi:hypothetical protein
MSSQISTETRPGNRLLSAAESYWLADVRRACGEPRPGSCSAKVGRGHVGASQHHS